MPLREFLRGLMGLSVPGRNSDENNNRDAWSNDPFYDLFRDFSAMLDETQQRSRPPDDPQPDDDGDPHYPGQDDFDFSIFPQPDEMFRHFEEQFRRTFQGFGMMEFPPGLGRPPIEAPPAPTPAPPGGDSADLRGRMLKPGVDGGQGQADTDVDDRVSGGGLAALLDDAAPPVVQPFHSFSSSITVRRHIGPDGRLEEHRVETRPDGSRRETVRRRLGDQEETTVTTSRPDGTSETEQHTSSPEDGDDQDFGRLWRGSATLHPSEDDPSPHTALLPATQTLIPNLVSAKASGDSCLADVRQNTTWRHKTGSWRHTEPDCV